MRGTRGIAAACFVMGLAAPMYAEGWTRLPSMPGAKHHAVGVQAEGTLYVVGGPPWVNRGDEDASVFRFSDGVWTTAQPIDGEGPVLGLGGGLDGLNRIVVFGGINSDNGDIASGKVYDPDQGAQDSIADRHDLAPHQHFAVARDAQGRLYSIGGGAGQQGTNSGFVERYNATTDAWQQVASVPAALADACACSDGAGHILVFGGYNANGTTRSADVWRFDVELGTWNNTLVPDLPVALTNAVAVLGNDHRIYVLGGESGAIPGGTVLSSVHVLNLIDNTWSAAPSMSVPRRDAAAMLASDDHIVIAGGTSTGGTALSSAEKLSAPTCPTFLTQSPSAQPWLGQTISISASVGGGTPMTFQWNRDGVPLEEGSTGSGSTVSGSATPTLTIMSFGPSDVGSYRLDATNGCGSSSSPVIALSLRVPPPIPAHWTVTNLHPAWAEASGATCVSNGRQGGYGIMDVASYNNLQQPVLWEGTAGSALNITPGGSVGGAVFDMEGDTAVGSWWWPFQCYVSGQWYTCYYWQACRWTGIDTPQSIVHDQLQISGNDVGSASVVHDGVIGGSQTPEEGLPGSFGAVWTAPNFWGTALSAPNTSASFVGGVDGGDYFGSIQTPYPGPTNHAARFPNGSTSAWMDLHPAGFASSGISDADEGQQVGTTGWYNDSKAAVWYGTAVSHLSLHPAGATRSGLVACMAGVQCGFATVGGIERATLWNGTAASAVDLHGFLPGSFTASSPADLEVLPDGSMVVVGSAYNATTARWEAVMWTSGMDEVLGDLDGDGEVDGADLAVLLGAWGTADRAADLDADGSVNGADLAILLGAWM